MYNNTKTIELQNQLQSTYSKLDVFLKDFIESLNDSVEQYKKSVTEKLSVDSIYGDCQTLLLELVKASKQGYKIFILYFFLPKLFFQVLLF